MSDASDPSRTETPDALDPLVGRRVGGCTITRLIGAGGMGGVYEAEQENPRRTVAVKVMRFGFETDDLRRRFEMEAQILGALRHPGIAQVYEAGAWRTPSGDDAPYFVMELIPDALPVTDFADARRLDVRARLDLFARICDAVHAGHQKGVIHRDLKPANLLVDPEGRPKVIDFGVARATSPELAAGREATEAGMLLGTLPYMSPEQIESVSEAIDVRSDVYALGVVLYELLCGRLPHRLEGLPLGEAAKTILRAEPEPPAKVRPGLDQDVETIVLKALAKLRERRYASADELARDVRRYLVHEPIHARPASLAYQLRLLARRHRTAFGGALIALVALVAAAIVSMLFAVRAERQRERAAALLAESRTLPTWLLTTFTERIARLPRSTAALADLTRRVRDHLDALAVREGDDPALQADVAWAYLALGDVLAGGASSLGDTKGAIEAYDRAATILDRLVARAPGDAEMRRRAAAARLQRGAVHRGSGRLDEAARDLDEATRVLAPFGAALRGTGPEARLAAQVELRRGDVAWSRERWADALARYEASLALWRPIASAEPDNAERVRSLAFAELSVGDSLATLDRDDEARPHLDAAERGVARLKELADPKIWSQSAWHLHLDVGDLASRRGRWPEAAKRFQTMLALAEERAKADPEDVSATTRVLVARERLASVREKQDDWAGALALYEASLGTFRDLVRADPENRTLRRDLRVLLTRWAAGLRQTGKAEAAVAALEEARREAEVLAKAPDAGPAEEEGLADVLIQTAILRAQRSYDSDDAFIAAIETALVELHAGLEVFRRLAAAGTLPETPRANLPIYERMVPTLEAALSRLRGGG